MIRIDDSFSGEYDLTYFIKKVCTGRQETWHMPV